MKPLLTYATRPLILLAFLTLLMSNLAGGQAAGGAAPAKVVEALRAEVANLKARLDVLEAIKPTFTSFMPNFSERFHVMHRAGDAGDWATAQHELAELKRLVGVAKAIDAQKGQLMEGFLAGSFKGLGAAIEHTNRKKFRAALEQTVASCNKCHQAAGSPFIRVSLDVPPNMTMRHPHVLRKTKGITGHMH
ncbi:MAG: hypothetical protein O7E56_01050, partial [SAR324 cluster bacterium]|nr:hypothetical protein [SAR324 cluster bacterium]